jgi:hypothetical protein
MRRQRAPMLHGMRQDDDNEPVFVRSRWGAKQYVYNHRSPAGRVLIVLTLIVSAVALLVVTR